MRAATAACICSSAAVTVLDHRQAGILRSYSSSISAAERLRSAELREWFAHPFVSGMYNHIRMQVGTENAP